MNLNKLFKALQAGYEYTNNEPILGKITKESFIKSIRHDIYENGITILLNESLNNHNCPSVYCSARMIIEELAILKGIEQGLLDDFAIQHANLSQRFRFDKTQKLFLDSIAKIDDKDQNIAFVNKDYDEILNTLNELKASAGFDGDIRLEVYDLFTKKGMQSLIKKTLGDDFAYYRKVFSFFLHWNYLDEEVEQMVLNIANKGLNEVLEKVEELVYTDVSKDVLPKYKSFNSYIKNKKEEMKRLKEIEFSWDKGIWYFNTIPIDIYCFKRYKAISLDFKICLIFGFKLSVCKRSKIFVELCSINERLVKYYGNEESLRYITNLLKTSSYIRLLSLIDNNDIREKINLDKWCYDFYNEYVKDKKDISYTEMINLLGEGALSFYSLLGDSKTIAKNVLMFADGDNVPEIDKLLLNVLFKSGNKIDHFTGGYPNLSSQIMDYWTSRTYLQTILIAYSHLAVVFQSLDSNRFDKEMPRAINATALEMMDYGADEFLKLVKSEYDPNDDATNPFNTPMTSEDGQPFDILKDFYKDSSYKNPFKK